MQAGNVAQDAGDIKSLLIKIFDGPYNDCIGPLIGELEATPIVAAAPSRNANGIALVVARLAGNTCASASWTQFSAFKTEKPHSARCPCF